MVCYLFLMGGVMPDDVARWLEGLGLGQYGDVFVENEIDLDAARHLEDSDLKELGLPMGPRKKLVAAIAELTAPPQGTYRRQP